LLRKQRKTVGATFCRTLYVTLLEHTCHTVTYVGAPLELLEILSMTFQRFYLTQHSVQIQTESDSESKALIRPLSDSASRVTSRRRGPL